MYQRKRRCLHWDCQDRHLRAGDVQVWAVWWVRTMTLCWQQSKAAQRPRPLLLPTETNSRSRHCQCHHNPRITCLPIARSVIVSTTLKVTNLVSIRCFGDCVHGCASYSFLQRAHDVFAQFYPCVLSGNRVGHNFFIKLHHSSWIVGGRRQSALDCCLFLPVLLWSSRCRVNLVDEQ